MLASVWMVQIHRWCACQSGLGLPKIVFAVCSGERRGGPSRVSSCRRTLGARPSSCSVACPESWQRARQHCSQQPLIRKNATSTLCVWLWWVIVTTAFVKHSRNHCSLCWGLKRFCKSAGAVRRRCPCSRRWCWVLFRLARPHGTLVKGSETLCGVLLLFVPPNVSSAATSREDSLVRVIATDRRVTLEMHCRAPLLIDSAQC